MAKNMNDQGSDFAGEEFDSNAMKHSDIYRHLNLSNDRHSCERERY